MACVFDAFLYSKNSGLIFTAKQRIIRPKEKKYEKETQGIFCALFSRGGGITSIGGCRGCAM